MELDGAEHQWAKLPRPVHCHLDHICQAYSFPAVSAEEMEPNRAAGKREGDEAGTKIQSITSPILMGLHQ
ncbi:hypothetical protein EYZ11_010830 [Aspergillus tanneri]|uniref:Uncharacterized protein n=1 Tax=Aspergillus tanneri TaxID=1220188 RepID=A0A4S3J6J0_9EURO|nr:hypothetical protein EYZ11_010830 [Aspergillus tanneri]